MDHEFWLFIDEAQLLYSNTHLWNRLALFSQGFEQFYVVAASSYGSHSGSASHSPPKPLISFEKRINLFPPPISESEFAYDRDLCVAFTQSEFEQFLELVREAGHTVTADVQERIRLYASNSAWPSFLHPGVAVSLTMHAFRRTVFHLSFLEKSVFKLCQQVNHQKVIDTDFVQDFIETNLPRGDFIYGLGRCVPRPPKQGFPAPLMAVFLDVLSQSSIDIPPINPGIFPSVVINPEKYNIDRESRSEPLRISSISPEWRSDLSTEETSIETSAYTNLAPFVKKGLIALTPRDRLLGDDLHGSMPLSLREHFTALPFSDFEQAAHDARRMGWLMQDPAQTPGQKIRLRLSTQWHIDYVTTFLSSRAPLSKSISAELSVCVLTRERESDAWMSNS